jgi:hypothetical protein
MRRVVGSEFSAVYPEHEKMKYVRVWLGACLTVLASQAIALTALPGDTNSCTAESTASFNSGFQYGSTEGYKSGWSAGYGQGWGDAGAYCFATPSLCGITLGSVLPAPEYGETEPNDNLIAADALPFDVNFWGQSYGAADEDWFYIVTTQANQNLTINFSVPNGTASGWKVAIRDSAGNLFADFDTSVTGSVAAPEGDVAYRVTLGFPGTYYLVVQTSGTNYYSTYNLAAVLQDSPLDSENFVVGFYDVELEPNDDPWHTTMLTTGVTMYGLINLTFDVAVPSSDSTREWAQGEWDWYAYDASGGEVVTLTFCGREKCERGEWYVEVYDPAGAVTAYQGGSAPAILAANTDNTSDASPLTYRFGFGSAGRYFLRVNHKRLFTAPCAAYGIDTNNDGLADGGACRCTSGDSCDIDAVIPKSKGFCLPGTAADPNAVPPTTATAATYSCPDGSDATEVSRVPADATPDECTGGDIQCGVSCQCRAWSGVVEIPDGAVTSQYNFTWNATSLPPNTYATDAYQNYLGRPSPY